MSVLRLTLKKADFDVMVTGEKKHEYRKPSKWIMSRLVDKKTGAFKRYDLVEFVNGYGSDKPMFWAEFLIAEKMIGKPYKIMYSNLLEVLVETGDIVITIGKISGRKNV